eukprot:417392_1
MSSSLFQSFNILNVATDISTIDITHLPLQETISANDYIISDADEELLILIEFKQIINLQSLKLHALSNDNNEDLENASPPKHIHIYKAKNLNINFDDVQSLSPDKSIVCSSKKLSKGQNINFKKQSIKFNKTKYLVLYIQSNQNDTENTYFNGIEFNNNHKLYHYDKTNIDNNAKLAEFMATQVSNIDKVSNDIPLFPYCNPLNLRTNFRCEFSSQNISKCLSLNRIMKIDRTEYRNAELLEDFHHLLIGHMNEFESIYHILIESTNDGKQCELSQCDFAKRNYRDRQNDLLYKQLYDRWKDDKDIIHQQLIDKIHCYFYHTFDIGHRLRHKDKQGLLKRVECKHDANTEISTLFAGFNNLPQSSQIVSQRSKRFASGIIYANLSKMQEKKENETKQSATNQYSFGYRFFYWRHYKDNLNTHDLAHNDMADRWYQREFFFQTMGNDKYKTISADANEGSTLGDWYVDAKYKNLKTELISNQICKISSIAWNHLVDKAELHSKGSICKATLCDRRNSAELYDIKRSSMILVDHLVAMMAYCNFDLLQAKLTQTYRKVWPTESRRDLISRHSNYAHWGRLLRECVECFGINSGGIKSS